MGNELPPLLNAAEAAGLLRVSKPTVIKLCESGDLTARKVRTQWRINTESLLEYANLEIGDGTTDQDHTVTTENEPDGSKEILP